MGVSEVNSVESVFFPPLYGLSGQHCKEATAFATSSLTGPRLLLSNGHFLFVRGFQWRIPVRERKLRAGAFTQTPWGGEERHIYSTSIIYTTSLTAAHRSKDKAWRTWVSLPTRKPTVFLFWHAWTKNSSSGPIKRLCCEITVLPLTTGAWGQGPQGERTDSHTVSSDLSVLWHTHAHRHTRNTFKK